MYDVFGARVRTVIVVTPCSRHDRMAAMREDPGSCLTVIYVRAPMPYTASVTVQGNDAQKPDA
eukprot:22365-Eustigmatos_ZCMA.PRE.1